MTKSKHDEPTFEAPTAWRRIVMEEGEDGTLRPAEILDVPVHEGSVGTSQNHSPAFQQASSTDMPDEWHDILHSPGPQSTNSGISLQNPAFDPAEQTIPGMRIPQLYDDEMVAIDTNTGYSIGGDFSSTPEVTMVGAAPTAPPDYEDFPFAQQPAASEPPPKKDPLVVPEPQGDGFTPPPPSMFGANASSEPAPVLSHDSYTPAELPAMSDESSEEELPIATAELDIPILPDEPVGPSVEAEHSSEALEILSADYLTEDSEKHTEDTDAHQTGSFEALETIEAIEESEEDVSLTPNDVLQDFVHDEQASDSHASLNVYESQENESVQDLGTHSTRDLPLASSLPEFSSTPGFSPPIPTAVDTSDAPVFNDIQAISNGTPLEKGVDTFTPMLHDMMLMQQELLEHVEQLRKDTQEQKEAQVQAHHQLRSVASSVEQQSSELQAQQQQLNHLAQDVQVDREELQFQAQYGVFQDLLLLYDFVDLRLRSAWEKYGKEHNSTNELMIIRDRLTEVLKRQELTPIEIHNPQFDPLTQRALQEVMTSERHEDGTISRIFRQGFLHKNRVFRPSEVEIKRYPSS